jgi:hypothetical protein
MRFGTICLRESTWWKRWLKPIAPATANFQFSDKRLIVILRQLEKSSGEKVRGADVRSDQLLEGIATDRQLKPDFELLGNE